MKITQLTFYVGGRSHLRTSVKTMLLMQILKMRGI